MGLGDRSPLVGSLESSRSPQPKQVPRYPQRPGRFQITLACLDSGGGAVQSSLTKSPIAHAVLDSNRSSASMAFK